MFRLIFAVLATSSLLAACASASPGSLRIEFTTRGAHSVRLTLEHSMDAQHFCAAGGAPWAHVTVNGQELEVPPGPPSYNVQFAAAESSQPEFRLVALPYLPGMTAQHNAPDDSIAIRVGHHDWLGDGHTTPAPFSLEFAFAPDGQSGSFTARGLREVTAPGAMPATETIDVTGHWTCPPPAAQPASAPN